MKNIFTTLILILLIIPAIYGQNSYAVYPIPSVASGSADDGEVVAHAVIKNLTNADVSIRWTRVIIQLDSRLNTAFCDCITCWTPAVSEKTFILPANDSCDLDVHFYNDQHIDPPPAIVHIKLVNNNNAVDTMTAVYLLNPQSATGEPLPQAQVALYPNPVVDFFTLSRAQDVEAIQIFNAEGKLVSRFETSPTHIYPVNSLQSGVYWVALEDVYGRTFQVLQLVK